jgi:hypothetical protein
MTRQEGKRNEIEPRAPVTLSLPVPTTEPYTMATVEHNFSGALATWKSKKYLMGYTALLLTYSSKGVNLSELQKTLDTQGIELVENQKESVVGRKGLADKTKGS